MSAVNVRLAADITSLKKELGAARAQLDRLRKQGGKSAKGFADDSTSAFGRITAGAKGLGGELGILRLAGVASFGLLAKSVYGAGREIENATAQIQRDIGRIGPAADDALRQFDDALGQIPQAVAAVASAVGTTDTLLGLSGDALERHIVLLGKFSAVTRTDLAQNAAQLGQVFNAFNLQASEFEGVLDALYTSAAKTGIEIPVLLQALSRYGATLRALGFDGEGAVIMLGRLAAEGIQLRKVDEPLKSFAAKAAALNQEPRQALVNVVTEIENATTATDANAIAQEAFGTNFAVMVDIVREQGIPVVELLTDAYDAQTLSVENLYDATETLQEKQASAMVTAKRFLAELDRIAGVGVGVFVNPIDNSAEGRWLKDQASTIKDAFMGILGPLSRGGSSDRDVVAMRAANQARQAAGLPAFATPDAATPDISDAAGFVASRTVGSATPTYKPRTEAVTLPPGTMSADDRAELRRQADERAHADALALFGLQDRRYELGRVTLADHLAALGDRIDYFGGVESERGLDVQRRINELVTGSETTADDYLYVQLMSDDKPDRVLRAERGPIQTRVRGACG